MGEFLSADAPCFALGMVVPIIPGFTIYLGDWQIAVVEYDKLHSKEGHLRAGLEKTRRPNTNATHWSLWEISKCYGDASSVQNQSRVPWSKQ
jgi:hypothetical protein